MDSRKKKAATICDPEPGTNVRKKSYSKSLAVKQLEDLANDAARTFEDFYDWYNEKFGSDEI